jgi:hypothetical protein
MARVLGVELPSETPQEFRLEMLKQEVERRKSHDEAIEERVGKVETDVAEIKDAIHSSSKRTMIAIAVIGGAFTLAGSAVAVWGQLKSVQLGAQQGAEAGRKVVDDSRPSTEGSYAAGFRDGADRIVSEQLKRLQENPAPLNREPDRVAPIHR